MVSWFLTRVLRQYSAKIIVLKTNCAGKTGYLHEKEWCWTLYFHCVQKWVKDLNKHILKEIY
jgi:hypothetical protein